MRVGPIHCFVLISLVGAFPTQAAIDPEALGCRWLMYWAPAPLISATSYLLSAIITNTYVLQYCMRTLHHVDDCARGTLRKLAVYQPGC